MRRGLLQYLTAVKCDFPPNGLALPMYNVAGVVKIFYETPVVLRAGSGVKGGPTVFVGPFIADP
jgi:hypothetical protein